MPEKLPILTGWAPFRSAEILSAKNREFVVARSLETLQRWFFAGEATDVSGHNGTVHGAIASGERAAKEIAQIARQQSRAGRSNIKGLHQ